MDLTRARRGFLESEAAADDSLGRRRQRRVHTSQPNTRVLFLTWEINYLQTAPFYYREPLNATIYEFVISDFTD